jgi:hypothetical protein
MYVMCMCGLCESHCHSHAVTLSHWLTVTLSRCHAVTLSRCHTVTPKKKKKYIWLSPQSKNWLNVTHCDTVWHCDFIVTWRVIKFSGHPNDSQRHSRCTYLFVLDTLYHLILLHNIGIIHTTTAAATKYVKVTATFAQWSIYVYTKTALATSLDHCATWCLLDSGSCHLFVYSGGICYFGILSQTSTAVSGKWDIHQIII